MEIVKIKLEDLTPYTRNAKQHTTEQINQIKKSIQDFGNNDPIGVWGPKNIIVEGHGRYIALKELGVEEVECIRLDHLTDEERRAYTLVHNQTTMNTGWDMDMLLAELDELEALNMDEFGFDLEALEDDPDEKEIQEDDYNIDTPVEPKVKRGDVWILGNHRLMCGDSTSQEDMAKLMDGRAADLVITDPPYNVNYEGGTGMKIQNDNMGDAAFFNFLKDAFTAMDSVMKQGAPFYIWHADTEGYNFRGACRAAGWTVRQCLIWVKNSLVLGRQDYQWQHEPCLYGWKDGAAHYFVDDRTLTTVIEDARPNIKAMKKEEMQKLLEDIYSDKVSTSVIHEDKPARSDLHPTMKPVKLIARQMKNSSKPGDIVLDSFGGSGTTLITAEQLNRKCRTIELDEHYADVIIDRWEEFTGLKAFKKE